MIIAGLNLVAVYWHQPTNMFSPMAHVSTLPDAVHRQAFVLKLA